MIPILIPAVAGLIVGGLIGYAIFRYVVKGKYNEMIAAADKEAEVIKEKKLLEVREKFLNKKQAEAARNLAEPASGGTRSPQARGGAEPAARR